MSVTHIAGPRITIGPRQIQRCSVCGEKLVDNLPFLEGRVAMVSTRPMGPVDQPGPSFWPVGEPIQHDGNHWSVLPFKDGDNLPKDCCIDLVED